MEKVITRIEVEEERERDGELLYTSLFFFLMLGTSFKGINLNEIAKT